MITITKDGLKTFFQGALGAMTFGAYHQYTTNKIIELNNRHFEYEILEMKKENKQLRSEINELKQKRI